MFVWHSVSEIYHWVNVNNLFREALWLEAKPYSIYIFIIKECMHSIDSVYPPLWRTHKRKGKCLWRESNSSWQNMPSIPFCCTKAMRIRCSHEELLPVHLEVCSGSVTISHSSCLLYDMWLILDFWTADSSMLTITPNASRLPFPFLYSNDSLMTQISLYL